MGNKIVVAAYPAHFRKTVDMALLLLEKDTDVIKTGSLLVSRYFIFPHDHSLGGPVRPAGVPAGLGFTSWGLSSSHHSPLSPSCGQSNLFL